MGILEVGLLTLEQKKLYSREVVRHSIALKKNASWETLRKHLYAVPATEARRQDGWRQATKTGLLV